VEPKRRVDWIVVQSWRHPEKCVRRVVTWVVRAVGAIAAVFGLL
jgi:hypothetical protein